ncbi:MAG: LexA family protein [Pigmentiphaga sp.]
MRSYRATCPRTNLVDLVGTGELHTKRVSLRLTSTSNANKRSQCIVGQLTVPAESFEVMLHKPNMANLAKSCQQHLANIAMDYYGENSQMIDMHNRIAETRKTLGWTMAQLAERLDCDPSTIDKLEKGKTNIVSHWLPKLALAMNVPVAALLGEDTDTTPVPVISWVAAGGFADTVDAYPLYNAPRVIQVAGLKPSKYIALEVKGDSMNRITPEGSMIIVDLLDRELRDGRLYIFRMIDETTFKRYRRDQGVERLEPASTNEAHGPLFPQREIDVVGRVVLSFMEH